MLIDTFLKFTAIKAEKERRLDEHRCLILGCGEAGKTTFIKQMHIIHKQGFPEESRREQKLRIAENIIQAITVLLRNMTFVEENEFFADAAAAEAYQRIDAMTDQSPQSVFERADDFKLLWENAIVQAVYSRRNQFQIVECAAYFLSKVHLVMAENYLPSDNDILQVRVMTKGIVKHPFEIAQKDRKRTLILVISQFIFVTLFVVGKSLIDFVLFRLTLEANEASAENGYIFSKTS